MAYFLRLSIVVLFSLLVCGCAAAPPATEKGKGQPAGQKAGVSAEREVDDDSDPDVRLLKEAKIGTEDDNLIAYLKKHSESDDDLIHLDRLIRQLGDDDFDKRERASGRLVHIGLAALPALRNSKDKTTDNVARFTKECADRISKASEVNVRLAIVRLLCRRKPDGTAEALLQYLPFAADDQVETAIYYGLEEMATEKGSVRHGLVKALRDPLPARRALAGCLVARFGNSDQRVDARKLLDDKEAIVRLRTAQGFLAGKDKVAVPVLIALLDEPRVYLSWQAEELLHYVAGIQAPEETVGAASETLRAKCKQAWQRWWKTASDKIDLDGVAMRNLRPILILCSESTVVLPKQMNHVWLFGCSGKARWTITRPSIIRDVHMLPENELVLAEEGFPHHPLPEEDDAIAVTDLGASTLWTTKVSVGMEQRVIRYLPNGDIVVLASNRVFKLTSEGKDISTHAGGLLTNNGKAGLSAHTKMIADNGRILCLLGDNSVIVEYDMDRSSVTRRTKLGFKAEHRCTLEVLPNGHFLIANLFDNELVEFDLHGKKATELSAKHCDAIQMMRAGNILGCTHKPTDRLIEFDREGRVLWESSSDYRFRVIRTCFELVRFGFDHPRKAGTDLDSLSGIISALSGENGPERDKALMAIRDIGPKASEAVPVLVRMLEDDDEHTRRAAAEALASVGEYVIPFVEKALREGKPVVRAAAAGILSHFGPKAASAKQALIKSIMEDDNANVRRVAAIALGTIGYSTETLRALVYALKDKDNAVRAASAMTIGEFAGQALDAVPSLIEALETEDEHVHYQAAQALGCIKPDDRRIASTLARLLKSKRFPKTRITAARSLAHAGALAKEYTSDLIAAANATDVEDQETTFAIRAAAIGAMSQTAVQESAVREYLLSVLTNAKADSRLRVFSANALQNVEKPSTEELKTLEQLKEEPDDTDVHDAVVEALRVLHPRR